jgi:aminoglycoside 3-N-acetyltransferase
VTLSEELRALDVSGIVMVHASMRRVGGRAEELVRALLEVSETIMAYVDYEAPPFDAQRSPAKKDHGVLAEVIRAWPGAVRSHNPGASMAAIGARAEWLCADHPLHYGYGPGSPLAKLVEAAGQVLLLGSDPDQVTLFHYAEHVARLPNKRVVRDGDIEEFDTSEPVVEGMPARYFEEITHAFIDAGHARGGRVGRAQAFVLPARQLVEFAVAKMEREFGFSERSPSSG